MLDDKTVLNIIGNELSYATDDNYLGYLKKSLAYYLGQPDGREVQGRSTIVSTDVADTIEWALPEIVKACTRNNDVVMFRPEHGGDELQAQLETHYAHDVLFNQNDGFTVLCTVIKDALLHRNGVYKIFYEPDELTTTEEYTGVTDEELSILLQDDNSELVARVSYEDKETYALLQQQQPAPVMPMLHDVRIRTTIREDKIRVLPIPPEEFRISRQHNAINPKTARFCAHVTLKTASELIEEGVDPDVVSALPRHGSDTDREYRFSMDGETVYPNEYENLDSSQDLIEVAECITRIDINEDGIAELVKIRVAGADNPDIILDIEEIDEDSHPFGAGTAILMPHKFYGMSIFDRIAPIQDQKTALIRNIFDNLYLQNNQKTAVVTGRVNLDDLLVSRPGGIVRQDAPGMVTPIITPQIGKDAYTMLEYLDTIRAGRVGTDPDQNISDQVSGINAGDASVERIMTAREELIGLMIRTIAETVLRPMMVQIRNLSRRHISTVRDFNFRGNWVKIQPSKWRDRRRTVVKVGTGSGNTSDQQKAMTAVIQLQEKVLSQGQQTLVNEEKVYNAISSLASMSGVQNIDSFFIDPRSMEGQQAKQAANQQAQQAQMKEEQMKLAVIQSQMGLAKAEQGKVNAQMQANSLKAEIEQLKLQLKDAENRANATAEDLRYQLEYEKIDLEREKMARQNALEITKLEVENSRELSKINQQNKEQAASNG